MKLSLATKIFLGFVALLGGFALLALFSVREIQQVADDLRAIHEGHLALARRAAQLETLQQNRFRWIDRSLEETDPRRREDILRIALAYFPEALRDVAAEVREVATKQEAAQGRGPQSKERVLFYRAVRARIDRLSELHDQLDELTRLIMQRPSDVEPATWSARLEQLWIAVRAETQELNQLINNATARAVKRAQEDEANAVWLVIVMTCVALVIGVVLTVLAGRALAPIRRLVLYARAISRGDYQQSLSVPGDDELSALAEELRLMAKNRKEREDALDHQAAELEQAYRRVEELKQYHERIVRSLRTGVVVTDRELRITSTNPAAETHWGLLPEATRGRPLPELPLGALLAEKLGSLDRLVDATLVQLEAVALDDRLTDITVAPLQNERGQALGLVVALEDVTEAVRTKEALIRNERLAAIGRMSAHVTHEVRNPLSSIGLNAELLEDLTTKLEGPNGAESQALCRAIVREVDRLSAITEEYLRFARLPRPELREEAPETLLASLASFVRRDCEAAGVKLQLVLPALPKIHLDADQIRQAVLNLLRNAKESMPQGGELTLSAEHVDDTLIIHVRDTGVGIAPENVARIFDPFYSTKLTGTGLGLALTQQIVAEHGGQIRVNSKVGVGSDLSIVLPLRQHPETSGVLSHSQPDAQAPPRGTALTLLLDEVSS